MARIDNRLNNELREVKITRDFTKYAQGSVLIEVGNTKIICTAFVEEKIPPFLKGQGKGWVSAEYNMLPSSTQNRKSRDIARLKLDGRSSEIQRLIGRSLRSCVDMEKLGERTVWIDCDVIQADGGTRVTSITGSFVALYDALNLLVENKTLLELPIKHFLGAVSVGIVKDEILLDLCYEEDSSAIADMNVAMTDKGEFIEIQATSEIRPIKEEEFNSLLLLAKEGIYQLIEKQKKALGL